MKTKKNIEKIQVNILFPKEIVRDLDNFAGARKRSDFVVEATLKEIKRQKFIQSLKKTGGILKKKDYPEFSTGEKVDKHIGNLRGNDMERIKE